MDTTINVKSEAVALIKKHFGESAAKLYQDSFAAKPDSIVLVILRELLSEYLGKDQAKSRMGTALNNLYNQYENKN